MYLHVDTPCFQSNTQKVQSGELNGSVVEPLTKDWGVEGSSLIGITVLRP